MYKWLPYVRKCKAARITVNIKEGDVIVHDHSLNYLFCPSFHTTDLDAMPKVRALIIYLFLAFTIPVVLSAPVLSNGLRLPFPIQHTSATNSSKSGIRLRLQQSYVYPPLPIVFL